MLAEMGVAIGVDGHTVGLFQPRRVCYEHGSSCNVITENLPLDILVFSIALFLLCAAE